MLRARQGVFPPSSYAMLGLPGNWYGALEWQYPPHMRQGSYEEEGRAVNTLKARPGLIGYLGVMPLAPGQLRGGGPRGQHAEGAPGVVREVRVHAPCARAATRRRAARSTR